MAGISFLIPRGWKRFAMAGVAVLGLVEALAWVFYGWLTWTLRNLTFDAGERQALADFRAHLAVAAGLWAAVHVIVLAAFLRGRAEVPRTVLLGVQVVDLALVLYGGVQRVASGQGDWTDAAQQWIPGVVPLAAALALVGLRSPGRRAP